MLLGEKIRSLRRRQGLTVQSLAVSCGLSKGFISQVENGRTSPSLNTLCELARVLGVSPAFLISTPAPGAHVTRGNGRYDAGTEAARAPRAVSLTDRPKRGFDLYQLELPAGAVHDGAPLDRPGEQAAHVLSGWLRVRYEEDELDLRSGDTAHWEMGQGVTLSNVGADPVKVMIAVFPAEASPGNNGEG